MCVPVFDDDRRQLRVENIYYGLKRLRAATSFCNSDRRRTAKAKAKESRPCRRGRRTRTSFSLFRSDEQSNAAEEEKKENQTSPLRWIATSIFRSEDRHEDALRKEEEEETEKDARDQERGYDSAEVFRRSSSVSQIFPDPDVEPIVVQEMDAATAAQNEGKEQRIVRRLRSSVEMETMRMQTMAYTSLCWALDVVVRDRIPEASSASAVYGMRISIDGRIKAVDAELRRLCRQVPAETRRDLSERLDEFLSTLGGERKY